MESADQAPKGLPLAKELAWDRILMADANDLAQKSGSQYLPEREAIRIPYLDQEVLVCLREQEVIAEPSEPSLMEQVLVLRYLTLCDGTKPAGDWTTFRELPGGKSYYGPFLARTARPLIARFGHNRPAFERASRSLLGDRLTFGDSSFAYRLLPHAWLAIVLHLGDEEFSPEVTILFDRALHHQFTTEDCAVAAQVLCQRLLRAAAQPHT